MSTLMIGDARLDRVADLERFDLALTTLFPDADPASLLADRHWLEPRFMQNDAIALSMHSLVLRIHGRVILIDTCVGEHKPRPNQPPWHARANTSYLSRLACIGLQPDDVDMVLCTHLHADHVGWNTKLLDGRWVPTFPRARYIIGRGELTHWQAETLRNPTVNHGSYTDSVLPVLEAGRVDLVDADDALLDGVTIRALPGHAPGQIGLAIESRGERGLLCGDAIHHPVQLVRPDWCSKFCFNAAQAHATRSEMLDDAAERGTWLAPAHFMGLTALRIRKTGDSFRPRDHDAPM